MVAVAGTTTALAIEIMGGLAGLEEYTRYRLITEPDDIAGWLEAEDEPAINLPCADAAVVAPGYSIEISDDFARELDLEDAADARVLLIVQNWNDPDRVSVSVNGPIVLNTRTGRARQFLVPGVWRLSLL
ncbi:MAG: flagellar assembly protein FliW [Dehalococcoidia bacterium]